MRVRLQVLMLAGHNFNGTLPPAWTRLQQLKVLDASHNNLTGSVPAWYSSMRQLAVLKLHDNQLVSSNDSAADQRLFSSLVGIGSQLQCLSVEANQGELVSVEIRKKLQDTAKSRRNPPVPLAINNPTSHLCDPAPWKS
jgi:hypothetical protein